MFKDVFQICGQQIIYCGMVSHHQNAIVERSIKSLTLGSHTLLFRSTILWLENVIIIMCTLSFKVACQRYNILDMDEDRNTPEQKFYGVGFLFFLQTTTPGSALSFSYKPHCREVRHGYPNGNQGKLPEYILDTPHSKQFQWP